MINVTLQCRGCGNAFKMASEFEPEQDSMIEDTQHYMNTQFVALCGCGKRSWEVTEVEPLGMKGFAYGL